MRREGRHRVWRRSQRQLEAPTAQPSRQSQGGQRFVKLAPLCLEGATATATVALLRRRALPPIHLQKRSLPLQGLQG